MYLWLRGGLLDCFAWPAKVGSRRVDGVLCCLCVCLIPRAITIITLLELHWCGPATSSEFTWLTEAAPARPASRLVLPERVALMSKEDRKLRRCACRVRAPDLGTDVGAQHDVVTGDVSIHERSRFERAYEPPEFSRAAALRLRASGRYARMNFFRRFSPLDVGRSNVTK